MHGGICLKSQATTYMYTGMWSYIPSLHTGNSLVPKPCYGHCFWFVKSLCTINPSSNEDLIVPVPFLTYLCESCRRLPLYSPVLVLFLLLTQPYIQRTRGIYPKSIALCDRERPRTGQASL